MTCGLTDEEMTVNSTAKENEALQTLYNKAQGSLPVLLYTQGWAVPVSHKAIKHNCQMLVRNAKLQSHRFKLGHNRHQIKSVMY